MNLNMEALKSADIENLIKSINIEIRSEFVYPERLQQLTLKKKLLKDELAHRILLEAFDDN